MNHTREEQSLGELLSDLSQETQRLFRQEVELAKTEMSLKMSHVLKDIAFLAIGGAVAYAGLLALISAVILGLGTGIPWWLSALLVGAVVAGIGYVLVKKGMDDLKRKEYVPKQTLETIKEDKRWLKEKM
ncbi:MAG: phage holin family protein [Nitrospirota bacterium]